MNSFSTEPAEFLCTKTMGAVNKEVREGGLTRLSLFFAGEFLSKCFGNTLETFYCKVPRRGRNNWCASTRGAVITGTVTFHLTVESCMLKQTSIPGLSDPISD